MYRAPHKCPVCDGKMIVTRLSCPVCNSRLEGEFDGCRFCSLSPEEERFLLTFIKNRGSIKDVEREMGVSYPTVRAALDGLIMSLGLAQEAVDGAQETAGQEGSASAKASAIGSAEGDASRERGKTANDPEKVQARRDILNLLAQHRITADEAAKRLKKL